MQVAIPLLLIACCVVFIIDISGAVDNFIKPIIKLCLGVPQMRDINIKPLDCSLCITFWIGLIYILIVSPTLMSFFCVCAASMLTINIKDAMLFIRDLLTFITEKLWKMIGR